MSKSMWRKRWLYDSKVEVPRTTRWRRRTDFSGPVVEHENDGVLRGEFASEVYEDWGKNTSPVKKQRLLNDCLSVEENEIQTSNNKESQTTVVTSDVRSDRGCDVALPHPNHLLQEIVEFENMEDEAVDCRGKENLNFRHLRLPPRQNLRFLFSLFFFLS